MKVGVKYCGNCNPRIDAGELAGDLAAAVKDITFVRWDDQSGYDVLLILNSCPVGCATQPAFKGPNIIVTNESIQRWPVAESELKQAVLNVLKEL